MRKLALTLTLAMLTGCVTRIQTAPTSSSTPSIIGSGATLNALAFGATADGKTDDTAAIQKALDAAAGNNDTVFFPAGTYLVSTLRVPARVGLLAHPTFGYTTNGGAILKLNDPKAKCLLDLTSATGATISGLCLDGNNQLGENIHGILIDKPNYGKYEDAWRIERCRVSKFSGNGVTLNRIWCFTIRHSMIAFNKGNGIRLRGWDGFILDNWLSGNGSAGIGAYEENAAITVTANRIEWNQNAGIEIHAGNVWNITGNYFDRSGGPGIKLMSGPLWGTGKETPCTSFSITGNIINRNGATLKGHAPDPADNCHLRFEGVNGLTCTGNTMTVGRDDGAKGVWSPETGIRCRALNSAVIKDNALFEGAIKTLVDDQGQHTNQVLIQDNPGSLRKPVP